MAMGIAVVLSWIHELDLEDAILMLGLAEFSQGEKMYY